MEDLRLCCCCLDNGIFQSVLGLLWLVVCDYRFNDHLAEVGLVKVPPGNNSHPTGLKMGREINLISVK